MSGNIKDLNAPVICTLCDKAEAVFTFNFKECLSKHTDTKTFFDFLLLFQYKNNNKQEILEFKCDLNNHIWIMTLLKSFNVTFYGVKAEI